MWSSKIAAPNSTKKNYNLERRQDKTDKTQVKLVPTDCEIRCFAVSEAMGSYINVIFLKAKGGECHPDNANG